MLREPVELTIGSGGQVALPLGLLAEAGLDAGSQVLAYGDGDGRVVLRRQEDAVQALVDNGTLS
ncbi:AbrB/MazE/SpoVT family DNA-binding domain-containing protein [Streptacidiphilus sp. MAP12-16]|uniref:AbrB/MazE/SpoVT family DNA-binding domain-containing protein n=1 Tax=Streptacidiphilus sp. MAP12-16 TaxID=3156300 RepID=UPI0035116B0B